MLNLKFVYLVNLVYQTLYPLLLYKIFAIRLILIRRNWPAGAPSDPRSSLMAVGKKTSDTEGSPLSHGTLVHYGTPRPALQVPSSSGVPAECTGTPPPGQEMDGEKGIPKNIHCVVRQAIEH